MMNPEDNEAKYTGKDLWLVGLICALIVAVLLFVWAISRSPDKQFAAEFTFAATISSIILSFIAIIMSITSETKTNIIRRSIKKEVKKLDSAISDMQKMTEIQRQTAEELQAKLRGLEEKVDAIQSDTHSLILNREKEKIDTAETLDPLKRNVGAEIDDDGALLNGPTDGEK